MHLELSVNCLFCSGLGLIVDLGMCASVKESVKVYSIQIQLNSQTLLLKYLSNS